MRLSVPVFLALLFSAGTAAAQSSPEAPPDQAMAALRSAAADVKAPQVQKQGAITFVSGGVGEEDRSALRQMAQGYNLRLMFAVQSSGEYLANIGVTLVDAQSKTVLDAISEGPFFFAHMPPGRYKLTVANDGKSQTRSIDVAASGAVSPSFYWPQGT